MAIRKEVILGMRPSGYKAKLYADTIADATELRLALSAIGLQTCEGPGIICCEPDTDAMALLDNSVLTIQRDVVVFS